MLRLGALLTMLTFLLAAQSPLPPSWKEFSMGPVKKKQGASLGNLNRGEMRAGSISVKWLVSIATGVPPARIVCPDWMNTEHYSVVAVLSDEARLRMQTREENPVEEDFRRLFEAELVRRFQLEYHREARQSPALRLQPAPGRELSAPPSTKLEWSRLVTNSSSGAITLEARDVTYRAFGNWLQTRMHRAVTVAESLPEDVYTFRLRWKASDEQALLGALRDQLGLELVEAPISEDYIVVDRAVP